MLSQFMVGVVEDDSMIEGDLYIHPHHTRNGNELELSGPGRGKAIELVPRLHTCVPRVNSRMNYGFHFAEEYKV